VWLIASEASANAVKHANASMLNISFTADASNVILRINDDGCGGVTAPPRTIVSRVQEAGGELNLTSPSGGGTDLVVVFDRTGTLAA
jgi:signal transduction histidine kinase